MSLKSWLNKEHIPVGKGNVLEESECGEESEPGDCIGLEELEVLLELEEKYNLFTRCGKFGKKAVERIFTEYNEKVDRKILDSDLIFLVHLDEFNKDMRRYSARSL